MQNEIHERMTKILPSSTKVKYLIENKNHPKLVILDLSWIEGLFEALVYIVYIRERYYFSLVCTSEKAINYF